MCNQRALKLCQCHSLQSHCQNGLTVHYIGSVGRVFVLELLTLSLALGSGFITTMHHIAPPVTQSPVQAAFLHSYTRLYFSRYMMPIHCLSTWAIPFIFRCFKSSLHFWWISIGSCQVLSFLLLQYFLHLVISPQKTSFILSFRSSVFLHFR